MTEVQLYKSASCQPGSGLIRAFSDVEKPILFFDLAVSSLTSKNPGKCFIDTAAGGTCNRHFVPENTTQTTAE